MYNLSSVLLIFCLLAVVKSAFDFSVMSTTLSLIYFILLPFQGFKSTFIIGTEIRKYTILKVNWWSTGLEQNGPCLGVNNKMFNFVQYICMIIQCDPKILHRNKLLCSVIKDISTNLRAVTYLFKHTR